MSMMSLGMFVFSLRTTPFQQRQRQRGWRHASGERLGKRPSRQYMGQGDDTVTLSGNLKPEITGGPVTLDTIATMADSGEAFPLIDGEGKVRGMYIIEALQETATEFFSDGTARSIDFSITLQRVDDERRQGRS